MANLAEGLKQLLRGVLVLALGVALIVAIFVAWWLALLLALGFVGVWKLRRMFPGKRQASRPARADPLVIEGEYSVEPEPNWAGRRDLVDNPAADPQQRKPPG